MPVRFGYDESLPDNWTNTGDTYNGPGIASNMQSFGMNGSPYSALFPQGQANPFAGTLAMNPGATDTNNFGAWESQFQNPTSSTGNGPWNGSPQGNPNPGWNASTGSWNPGYGPGQTNSTPPVIGSPSLTGGGQRPASASGTGGYDPNWQSLLTPYNTSNPGAAGDPDAWVRNLDQATYYKYILPYQQRGGNIRDIGAMQKVIQDGMSASGGGQWANGSQVNSVAGPRNDYLNNPNAYDNQNRGGVSSPAAPGTTGQPTQNGSVGGSPQFNWPNLPQVDPAINMSGGVLDRNLGPNGMPANFAPARYNGNNAGQLARFLAGGGAFGSGQPGPGGAGFAPGSMEERYAAMYGGGGQGRNNNGWGADPNGGRPVYDVGHGTGPAPGQPGYDPSRDPYLSRYPSASSGMQGIGEVPSYNPFGSGPPPNYASGGFATGGMDQPWNQGGGGRAATNPNWNGMNDYSIPGGYQFGGSPQGGDPMQQLYQLYQQNPQLFNYGQNGGQVSGYSNFPNYGGLPGDTGASLRSLSQQYLGFGQSYGAGQDPYLQGSGGAAPGSMQQRNQAYFQNPGAAFGSPSATPSGGGSTAATPVMASPSFGFGSATGRRTGYGNQSSYYGGGSNPNAFGGSSYGNYNTGRPAPPNYSSPGYSNTFNSMGTNNNSSGGFAAGRTGRPSSFTF